MTNLDNCCIALGGGSMEQTAYGAVCENAILLGRPYDVFNPCEYQQGYEAARSKYPFGDVAFRIGYFLGSTSAFLIPSTSVYTASNPENPPLSTNYETHVTNTADQGLKIFGVLVVIVGFLVYKYRKK